LKKVLYPSNAEYRKDFEVISQISAKSYGFLSNVQFPGLYMLGPRGKSKPLCPDVSN